MKKLGSGAASEIMNTSETDASSAGGGECSSSFGRAAEAVSVCSMSDEIERHEKGVSKNIDH